MGHREILVLVTTALTLGCKSPAASVEKNASLEESTASINERIDIQGAGATFPYPLYSKWISEFEKIDPKVRINYQSIGSGGGIRQIIERTADFGASDVIMSDEELARASGKLLHVPTTLGAVVIAFNLPKVTSLKMSRNVVLDLFLGEIENWRDPRIAELNPEVRLPDKPVAVVFRSDGSGSTAIFTEYLSSVSEVWKTRVGAGKSVKFPVGIGAKGNEGMTGHIKTGPGSVGYIELAFAKQTGLSYAAIENRAGVFVRPTLESIVTAATIADRVVPDDLRISIVDSPEAGAYPIATFSYILVYQNQKNARKGSALVRFLDWAIHNGQAFGPALHYAPLPDQMVDKVRSKLGSLNFNGISLGPRKETAPRIRSDAI